MNGTASCSTHDLEGICDKTFYFVIFGICCMYNYTANYYTISQQLHNFTWIQKHFHLFMKERQPLINNLASVYVQPLQLKRNGICHLTSCSESILRGKF